MNKQEQSTSMIYKTAGLLLIILTLFSFSKVDPAHAQSSDPNREIEIYEATLSSPLVHPDRPITLTWDTNADYVTLSYRSGKDFTHFCSGRDADSVTPTCPPKGTVTINTTIRELVFNAIIEHDGQRVNEVRTFSIKCDPAAWFFTTNVPEACPTESPTLKPLEIQYFEHGIMFRRKDTYPNSVYVFKYDDVDGRGNRRYEIVDASWQNGESTNDTPPSGLHEPIAQFGIAWNRIMNYDEGPKAIRDVLGWATAPSTHYMDYIQQHIQVLSAATYFAVPNGNVFRVNSGSGGQVWGQFSDGQPSGVGQPCPTSGVWPAGCVPASSPIGVPCPTSGVWPAGCVPGGSPVSPPTDGGGAEQPCPTSGVWPSGCIPSSYHNVY